MQGLKYLYALMEKSQMTSRMENYLQSYFLIHIVTMPIITLELRETWRAMASLFSPLITRMALAFILKRLMVSKLLLIVPWDSQTLK